MNGPARAPWSVFGAVALGTFMATLDSSIVNVALPTLARTFGASVTQIEWVAHLAVAEVKSSARAELGYGEQQVA